MKSVFGAIGRLFASIGYLLTGNIDAAGNALKGNPVVVQARLDEAIRKKGEEASHFADLVGKMEHQHTRAKNDLKKTSEDIDQLEQDIVGAKAVARKRVEELRQQNPSITNEELMADKVIAHAQADVANFTSSLERQKAHETSLKESIKEREGTLQGYYSRLRTLKHEIDEYKRRAPELVARLVTAQQQIDLDKAMAGFKESSGADSIFADVEETVGETEATAKVTSIASGADTEAARQKYRHAAALEVGKSDFLDSIGITTPTPLTESPEGEGVSSKPVTVTELPN